MTERQHGTYVRYVIDRCRCEPCRAANRAYERGRRSRIEPPYVDAAPARAHVQWLQAQGIGAKRIAERSGVPHGSISKLLHGDRARGMAPSKRIRPTTAEKLLAVTPADIADGARVADLQARETLAMLVAAGMPKTQIAERLGVHISNLFKGSGQVTARIHRAFAELRAELEAGQLTYERRWRGTVVGTVTIPAPNRQPANRHARARNADRVTLELATLLENRGDQNWRRSAACRGRPAWMWFPSSTDRDTIAAALRVCRSCIVRDDCLAANLHEPDGIWGATLPEERAQLRRSSAA